MATKKSTPTNNAGRPTGSYSSYGTSGYGTSYGGYGAPGNGAYGRTPYGANAAQPAQAAAQPAPAKGGKKNEKAVNTANMSGKQKKLAKRKAKFDENDLRNYPMKVGNWIGTFILLCIPIVNVICAICWFFGVGNRSRTSWVRSYIVIVLIILIVLGAVMGIGLGVLSKNAKSTEIEFDGVSYGTCGDYGFKGTVYYLLCSFIDTPIGEQIVAMVADKAGGEEEGGEQGGDGNVEEGEPTDYKLVVKAMLAQMILGIGESSQNPEGGEQGGEYEGELGGEYEGGEFGGEDGGEAEVVAVA